MNSNIQTKILVWYEENKRDLPWRKTRNPYKILVSEVMLQQTQVSRVVLKYQQFLTLFPTVQSLAEAKTSDILKAWAGLGYNRRALYLQKTAKAIVTQYKGKFPKNLELLKELPGIGDYTARAILSFAFGEVVPVLDTNHRKFYQRTYFGKKLVDDAVLLKKAEKTIFGLDTVYDWNQALMDFMSAVIQKSDDPLIVWYQKTYPAPQKKKKKNGVPFKDTDRYIRGRIIDALLTKKKIPLSIVRKKFLHIPKKRFDYIIEKLEKDGLILIQNKSILLP